MTQTSRMVPNEPPVFQKRDLNGILIHCFNINASDITIKTDECIFVEIHGKLFRITNKRLTKSEVQAFISELTGGEATISHLNSGEFHDCSYAIKENRSRTLRFRVNVVAILSDGDIGYEITIRTILSKPPDIKQMKIEKNLIDNVAPSKGMVLVTGATGSGKSTLLASIIRMLLEQEEGNRKIITYENPIEFVYDEVDKPSSIITQSEVPKNIKNFAEALKSALRRKPSVILIGEMRDKETISEGVIASMTGHLLYSTLHSNGVADTIRRMVGIFPTDEKNAAATDILSSLKMVIGQMLLPGVDGKRVAIREYLVFNEDIVDTLFKAGVDNLALETRKVLKKYGKSFLDDAKEKYDEGLISLFEYNRVKSISESQDKDLELSTHKDEKNVLVKVEKIEELGNNDENIDSFFKIE